MQRSYQPPQFEPGEATPERVRDELVACLLTAFGSARRAPNASPNPIQLRNDVERFVRSALEDAGSAYDRPTPQALEAVITRWNETGANFVQDASLVRHHGDQMSLLVSQIA